MKTLAQQQAEGEVPDGELLSPVIAQARSALVRLLLEPERITALAAADVPALIGDLERMRAALWMRMACGSGAEAPDPLRTNADEVLTVPEVASELRFTRGYVYEAVRRGDLAAVRAGKYVRIRRADLCVWLEGRSSKGLDLQPTHQDSCRHAETRAGPRPRARTAASVSERIHTAQPATAHPLKTRPP